jgi:hypothetical protein
LEADNCDAKHTVKPDCFLSKQGRKTRRVKKNFENYMFVTENGVDFEDDQFRALLSAYLHLDYEFQLIKVASNRFILTLDTHMPTDYACVVLDESKMLRLAGSDVICYSTDEYAEGYFGTPFEEYDHNDEVADIYTEVQILALPLRLRTIKAIERILLRLLCCSYCR